MYILFWPLKQGSVKGQLFTRLLLYANCKVNEISISKPYSRQIKKSIQPGICIGISFSGIGNDYDDCVIMASNDLGIF